MPVAILAQGCDLATTLCRGLGVPACQHTVAILSQACATSNRRRHGVFVNDSAMPHCRSPAGKWRHTLRSWELGYLPLPPPPPPPPIFGEVTGSLEETCPKPSRLLYKEVIAAPLHYSLIDEDDDKECGNII